MCGFIHDHASNLSGQYNGLGALIKKDLSHYFLDLKDPCHSLNLTATKALETLPIDITKFIINIHNHFQSPQRVAYLNLIQEENGWPVLNLCHYVQTQWLSLGQSLERLLTIWDSVTYYMKQKPPCPGMTHKKYESFSKLFEDKFFKLQIICLSAIIQRINETNIAFQKQSLEIQGLKQNMQRLITQMARLLLTSSDLPSNIRDFKNEEWKNIQDLTEKFKSPSIFITSLSTDLDHRLKELESISEVYQEKFSEVFQPFIAKILSLLISYFPYTDEIIESLDFVTLNMEIQDFKSKIFTFNEHFKVVPPEQIVELSKEISLLEEENIILLRKNTQKSSLRLWDLLLSQSERSDEYLHLSRIFKIAHSLPISSATVEQTFSTLKWIRNHLRSNLKEKTVESLIMLHQDFEDNDDFLSEEMLIKFNKIQKEVTRRKKKKDDVHVDLDSKENMDSIPTSIQESLNNSQYKNKRQPIQIISPQLKNQKSNLTEGEMESENEVPFGFQEDGEENNSYLYEDEEQEDVNQEQANEYDSEDLFI